MKPNDILYALYYLRVAVMDMEVEIENDEMGPSYNEFRIDRINGIKDVISFLEKAHEAANKGR